MRIEEIKKIEAYYEALIARDPEYVGIFYVGVKTTSVFCIATCRARKPKKENVEFFTTFKEALTHGYRPCKICRPTENANEAPPEVERAIDLVRSNPKEKITDDWLRREEIQPEKVRRWFKAHYGITYHAFQRMYRINNSFEELKNGKNATHTAFDSGYESLSGFGYTYKKVMGQAPSQNKDTVVILINRFTTPIGPMFVAATDQGVCLLEFTDRRMLETELKDLQRLLKAPILTGDNQFIKQAKKELAEYFAGKRKSFDVPLHLPGTPFQQQVWTALQGIPYGETRSYQQQAVAIEKPTSVRAVASANGHNRVSIMVPCHRVIGKSGALTGYGGGLERKRWLLDLEQRKD